jgi:hypothetical protein
VLTPFAVVIDRAGGLSGATGKALVIVRALKDRAVYNILSYTRNMYGMTSQGRLACNQTKLSAAVKVLLNEMIPILSPHSMHRGPSTAQSQGRIRMYLCTVAHQGTLASFLGLTTYLTVSLRNHNETPAVLNGGIGTKRNHQSRAYLTLRR